MYLAAEWLANHIVVMESSILVVEDGVLNKHKMIKGIMSFVHHNQVPILHEPGLGEVTLFNEVHCCQKHLVPAKSVSKLGSFRVH